MSEDKKSRFQSYRKKARGRKIFWAVVVAGGALALLSVVPGFGRARAGGAQGHRWDPGGSVADLQRALEDGSRWLEQADITEEQRGQLAAVLENVQAQLERLQREKQALEEQIAVALVDDEISSERFEELRQIALERSQQALGQSLDAVVQIAQVLTPEQRAELVGHWRER